MTSMQADADHIRECYRLILRREPENDDVFLQRLNKSPTIWDVFRDILDSSERRALERVGHAFSFEKCLTAKYLASSFNPEIGLRCFLHHTTFVTAYLRHSYLVSMMYRRLELTSFSSSGLRYSAGISLSKVLTNEGDLSLALYEDRVRIYSISFSFVPGDIFAAEQGTVILIGRMQGGGGRRDHYKRATRAANDISPQAYLFSVLRGIAHASDISVIYGVASLNQASYDERYEDVFRKAYDEFYAAAGFEVAGEGFYRVALPLHHKALTKINPWHRLRSKLKRAAHGKIAALGEEKWRSLNKLSHGEDREATTDQAIPCDVQVFEPD